MIKKIVFISFISIVLNIYSRETVILLDPAGHAKNTGRRLVDGYERAQTFQLASSLRQELEQKYNFKVLITRYPGEEIIDLQNASFSNRLEVDLFISLNIFWQENIKPKIYVYYLTYNPLIDFTCKISDILDFIPLEKSHYININKTRLYSENIKKILLTENNQKQFDYYGPYAIPFKPLKGIIAPAIAIEIGICEEEGWKNLVNSLVECLFFLN